MIVDDAIAELRAIALARGLGGFELLVRAEGSARLCSLDERGAVRSTAGWTIGRGDASGALALVVPR